MGGMIENEGYDACLQKAIPNLRIKGDKNTNPEVVDYLYANDNMHAQTIGTKLQIIFQLLHLCKEFMQKLLKKESLCLM